MTAVPLRTRRLDLEPLRVEHADEMGPLLDDPVLHTYTGGEPATPAQLRERYRRMTAERSPDGRQTWLNWILRRRADEAAVGTVQATVERDGDDLVAEIAWVVARPHQRQGYAREAGQAMTAWLREQGVVVVRAHVHPGHAASQAVAQAVGLRRTSTVQDGEVRWEAGHLAIDIGDVRAAAGRLRGVAHRTPVATSTTLDDRTGGRIFVKCENLQRTGSFKVRGAYNALARFTSGQRSAGVVAYSSGNHGQAVALAARLLGIPAVIVMPSDARPIKMAATRGYGADIVIYDRYTEDREAIGAALAAERGLTLVPPFDHPHVMAGQGTAALELLEQVREIDGGGLDVLVVPLGGGGLLSGCATVVADELPGCRIIGVEPAAGNDVQQSLRQGEIVHIDVPRTIADGAQTRHAGVFTFPVLQALVDDVVTVTDDQLVDAMRFVAERMKLVVEPTGALGIAAALNGAVAVRGWRVGVVASGGNVDVDRLADLFGPR
ncbi:MAG TPA: threo-3-hydroxy-L-aspartate ammonia-lyase [Kineosporiaceae bacterium]|nr:threo-3-hydroxy-L-aspartate ammonia-lyase [Kineosporiaceae bacterium]